jgi:dihydrofolate reductase
MKIFLLMAMTADGMIARDSNQLVDWTGKADKKYFVEITRKAGVMIMGSNTFDTIGKVLPGRKNIVMTRNQTKKSNNENLIFTSQSPNEIITDLQAQGFESVALIGGSIINTLFLNENLVDEVHLTMVPRIFGKGLALFDKPLDKQLALMDVNKLGEDNVLLRYKVVI